MKFLNQLTKIVNSGQSRSVLLTGNIYDLFYDKDFESIKTIHSDGAGKFVPLMEILKAKLKADPVDKQKGITQIVYQVNRPIEVIGDNKMSELETIWEKYHPGEEKKLKQRLLESNDNHVYAFELLRQITECSRKANGKNNLLVIIEAADMLLPECEIARMSVADRRAIGVVQDWLSDPDFMNGHDTVIMLSESRSLIHHRIARLPSVLSVDISLPDIDERKAFISHWSIWHNTYVDDLKLKEQTAGLSLHAIRQLLCSGDFTPNNIACKVEEYMVSQLGEGVVEFKRPTHTLKDIIGNSTVKKFLETELIPGFKSNGNSAISGAAVGGPIGGGKTHICEAVASELGIPVIVLKNIRSKWFGETDQIFERLRRLLETFYKIVIFVDEADTMFGDIQSDHDTERRLTGKVQGMMSDPALKGRVIWFLMTARIHRLSPDIRRPGRMDLILPILDPKDKDLNAFIKWILPENLKRQWETSDKQAMGLVLALSEVTKGYSAASFSLLKNQISNKQCTTIEDIVEIAKDLIMPDISDTREYQSLQAQLNCTRRSLLDNSNLTQVDFDRDRRDWKKRILELEAKGIS